MNGVEVTASATTGVRPISALNYKELQNIAMIFNLPANLKHGQMVQMLQARQDGDEDTVRKILDQYREERCRRKLPGTEWRPSNNKRRKLIPLGVPEDKLHEYCSAILPQILKEQSHNKTRVLPPIRSKAELGYEPSIVKLVTEATSTQTEPDTVQQSQPILRSLLQVPATPLVSVEAPALEQYVVTTGSSTSVLQFLPDTFSMPKFTKRANTSTFTCYRTPLCSTFVSSPPILEEAPWWPTEDVQTPECFRQNDKLSYPLIYSYLASTEDQEFSAQQLWGEPQATSSPSSDTPSGLLPLLDEACEVPCRYMDQGCVRGWIHGASEQAAHEQACEFQPAKCPLQYCTWNGRLRSLCNHLREVHKGEIVKRSEKSDVAFLHELRARQRLVFLRDVNRRLFVLSISCQGHLLHAAVQAVPSYNSKTATLVKAALEVVGSDGKPRSWRGKVRPYHEPLSTLWATGQCLTLDPSEIGVYAGSSVVLHSKLTAYVARGKK